METLALFDDADDGAVQDMGPQARVLRGFARTVARELLAAIDDVARTSAFRHMVTPGGFTMSAAMTNCGALGWTSDRRGYRYTAVDPLTGNPWPAMPVVLKQLASKAAAAAGFGWRPAGAARRRRWTSCARRPARAS